MKPQSRGDEPHGQHQESVGCWQTSNVATVNLLDELKNATEVCLKNIPNVPRRMTMDLSLLYSKISEQASAKSWSLHGRAALNRAPFKQTYTDPSGHLCLSNPAVNATPLIFDRYAVTSTISSGRFAQVFLSTDVNKGRLKSSQLQTQSFIVALKVLNSPYNILGVREALLLRHCSSTCKSDYGMKCPSLYFESKMLFLCDSDAAARRVFFPRTRMPCFALLTVESAWHYE